MGQRPQGRREHTVLQVFIFREGRFWGTECFAQNKLTIGRSPEVDLQLDDDIISRTHTEVSVTSEGLVVEDLGSSNGTFVNGEPVERCFVDSRDEVSIGSFTLKFKLLSKKKPRQRFGDETRIVDRDSARDMTEVVQPEAVDDDMLVGEASGPKPARPEPRRPRPVYQPEQKPYTAPVQEPVREIESRRGEIAAALREELGGFESPATERMERPSEAMPAGLETEEHEPVTEQYQPDEYAVETQVEQSPFQSPQPPAAAPDHGTRWLTPEPESGPSLELAPELQPESPARQAPDMGFPGPAAAPSPAPQFEPPLRPAAEELEPPLEGDWGAYAEDEEEEYQRDFVEPFSLLNNLIRENFAQPQVPTEPTPVVEIIGYSSEKQVLSYEQIGKGGRHRIGPKKFVLAHYKDPGSCRVLFSDDFSGGVITGGRTVAVDELKTSTNQVGRKKGRNVYAYKLMKGDYANLIHEGGGSFVRFVNPPKLPPAPKTRKLDAMSWKIFGSTFLAHILFIVILSFFSKDVSAASDADIDRFAKVDMKDIQMEKPEEEAEIPLDQLPPPEEEAEEEKKEEEKKEEPKEEPKKKPKKTRKRSRKKGTGGGDQGGGAGMMAALGNLSQKKPSRNIVAAVSNLDAVRVPGGRSRYKVSGLVTKLPTSSVVVSRGRGVGVKAGIDLLRGGKGRGGVAGIGPGALRGGRTGKRGVGGVVFKAPKRKMRVRGHLSRDAIAKVVRQHLREIQYCYEKNLLLNSKLAGKLIMEWTIAITGSVSVVKTKSNTMATPAVAMCISAKIKRWKFPRPKGGIVVVSYPFIFNSIGF